MLRVMLFPIFTLFWGLVLATNNSTPQPDDSGYPEQLPGAFTSGFGEESCHTCHFDYSVNPEDGSLKIKGLPEQYKPNQKYTVSITLSREDLGQAGFQISSRFEDGSQAGSFEVNSDHITFTKAKSDIQYLQHSLKGSRVNNRESTSWKINWTAPESASQIIVFNIAANAGNGDASAFGDFIYVKQIEIEGNSK